MKYAFKGDVATTYAQYLDADAGRTLVAEPGGVYDITRAAGQPDALRVPPDGRWAPVKPAKTSKESD